MTQFIWIWGTPPPLEDRLVVKAQVRHLMAEISATITPEYVSTLMTQLWLVIARYRPTGTLRLTFDAPVRGVAPGQFAVIWVGKRCLGGGKIRSTECGSLTQVDDCASL